MEILEFWVAITFRTGVFWPFLVCFGLHAMVHGQELHVYENFWVVALPCEISPYSKFCWFRDYSRQLKQFIER